VFFTDIFNWAAKVTDANVLLSMGGGIKFHPANDAFPNQVFLAIERKSNAVR
jgi:hypothetical protein